ncbi:MAG: class I SAM-dependent methyltransferase [Candidatus Eisenbacteria bacterium]|nr:class I SAM-dependent methyltransferase [Candidatus Eisenbacteria bacterium]
MPGVALAQETAYERIQRFPVEYVGTDHDPEFIRVARGRYGSRPNFQARCAEAADPGVFAGIGCPDLVCALETLEHIPERDSIRIIDSVSRLAPRRFVCSVPVEVDPALWIKNVGSLLLGYERHKQRPWREVFWAGIYQPGFRRGHVRTCAEGGDGLAEPCPDRLVARWGVVKGAAGG